MYAAAVAASGDLDFADGAGVFGNLAVGGEEGDAFDGGLGDEEAVEGVFVDGRKTIDGDGVFAGDGKFRVSIVEQSTAKFPGVYFEVSLLKGAFDGRFPYGERTEEELIVFVVHEFDGRPG